MVWQSSWRHGGCLLVPGSRKLRCNLLETDFFLRGQSARPTRAGVDCIVAEATVLVVLLKLIFKNSLTHFVVTAIDNKNQFSVTGRA